MGGAQEWEENLTNLLSILQGFCSELEQNEFPQCSKSHTAGPPPGYKTQNLDSKILITNSANNEKVNCENFQKFEEKKMGSRQKQKFSVLISLKQKKQKMIKKISNYFMDSSPK